jgi:ribonucleoside-diphosphate reductase beta chain
MNVDRDMRFSTTGDPALDDAKGPARLLDYRQLYELWERQQWTTQDLEFGQDRLDWHERFSDNERFHRMYSFATFFVGEQRVTKELAPMIWAAPSEEVRIFLCTQIADEARHVAFFDRFYAKVLADEHVEVDARLALAEAHVREDFSELFDEILRSRAERLAKDPEHTLLLVELVTIYHMVIEGMLGLTGQRLILGYHERTGTLPDFARGFALVARDEHRHVGFGARFLRDMVVQNPAAAKTITRTLALAMPVARRALQPAKGASGDISPFGVPPAEIGEQASRTLERRLRAIGLR